MDIKKTWSLQMFAEGGDGGMGGGEGAAQTAPAAEGAQAQPGQQPVQTAENAKTPFDELMKDPEYKAALDRRIRSAVANRFKNVNAERAAMLPMLQEIGAKYGIDVSDPRRMDTAAIVKAYLDDKSRLADEAMELGVTTEAMDRIKRADRILASQQAWEQEQAEQEAVRQVRAEAEQLKQLYPGFDYDAEMANPRFGNLVARLQLDGYDNPLRTAFEVMHHNEIVGGLLQHAVQTTKQQVANAVQAGAMRPAENGTARPADLRLDPAHLTDEQRKDIRARVLRGERVAF